MSKRKPPTFGDLAAGAAHGRRVVLSSGGGLDGPFVAALAKVNLGTIVPTAVAPSTWGDGVVDTSKSESDIAESPTEGGRNAKKHPG